MATLDSAVQCIPVPMGICLQTGSLVDPSHGFMFCSNPDSQIYLSLEDDHGYFYLYFKSVMGVCLERRIYIKMWSYFAILTSPQTWF